MKKNGTTSAARTAASSNGKAAGSKGKRSKLPYELRKSPIQGKGVFATRLIRKGERIAEYKGERITSREADRRYPEIEGERHHTFLFELDNGSCIDALVGGNNSRYINHSCDPNCEAIEEDERIFIEALRDIRKGQELVYDYHFILDERHTPAAKKRYPCYCGSSKCRGTILAKKR